MRRRGLHASRSLFKRKFVPYFFHSFLLLVLSFLVELANAAQRTNRAAVRESPPDVLLPGTLAHAVFEALAWVLFVIILLMMVYALRHASFTLSRVFGRQRHPYLEMGSYQRTKAILSGSAPV